jgi:hypothetical protein
MGVLWGVAALLLSLLCWGGQAISWFAPATGVRLTLMESEDSVEPSYFADIRGEALWDTLTLWTMPVAAVLLIADNAAWPYFGLVAGGMYVYFAGRGIFTRRALQHHGFRIGAEANVKVGFLFLAIWGVVGVITIAAAARALSVS